jgi:hypothetical protein
MSRTGYRRMPLVTLVLVITTSLLLMAGPATADQANPPELPLSVTISVNMVDVSLQESEYFDFTTTVTNNGTVATGALVAHLNVASLQKGLYVDPEDWSETRTVFFGPLGPGASESLTWKVHGLFAGDFAVYVVVLSKDSSTVPVSADEVHVHIEKWTVMQVAGVTPVVVTVPIVVGALYVGQRMRRMVREKAGDDPVRRRRDAEDDDQA